MPQPQQIVQSTHAAIECAKAFDLGMLPDHPSVILLAAKDENRLHRVRKYLIDNGIKHVHFYEPDLDNELTAIATEPIFGDRRDLFSKYQLVKEQKPCAERIQYARRHDDGSYFRWRGECGSSEHKTWNIGDANLFDSKEEAAAWRDTGEAVAVRISFHTGGVK